MPASHGYTFADQPPDYAVGRIDTDSDPETKVIK
jgi:hypothetical protein